MTSMTRPITTVEEREAKEREIASRLPYTPAAFELREMAVKELGAEHAKENSNVD